MSTRPVWDVNAAQTNFPALNTDIKVDVAIVGGGITGITAAYLLSKAGKTVAVLEALQVGRGSTGYSTGNLYAPVGGEGMHSLKSKWNQEQLQQVATSRAEAVNFIEEVVKNYNIDCDFKRVPWALFAEKGGNKSFVEKERKAAEEAGLVVTDQVSFPLDIETGFTVPGQAQFNPLKYVQSLAKEIYSDSCNIYENTKVTNVKDGDECLVETTGGNVTASRVIMATHTPKGIYFVQTSLDPYREYAVAVTLNGNYPEAGIFWNMAGTEHHSMRTYDTPEGKLLMVLGESHKVGSKESNEDYLEKLEKFLRKRFEVTSVKYKWSAQQYKPADGIPHIGISTGNKNTYIATGFAADGLTYGTLAAMIISDEITGKVNRWSKTYKASRITPVASFGKFMKENVSVAFDLIKDYLGKDQAKEFADIKPGEGKVMELENHKCAVHRDDAGNLEIVSAVCPHLGCIVHWNQFEQSWDCPCHGSRFKTDGEVIEGPAYPALKNKRKPEIKKS